MGIGRSELLSRIHTDVQVPGYSELITRRLNHEPIAYILGDWEFFSLEFLCRAPVLVPRPETEHLVEVALEHLCGRSSLRVLDLCTGTGCVAVSIAKNCLGASVTAVDIQPHAVALAKENVARHDAKVQVLQGNLFDALPRDAGPFDAIVSNPPYISPPEYALLSPIIQKHEDPVALLAGEDGLEIVWKILAGAGEWLAPGGVLAFEIGDTQWPAVSAQARGDLWGDVSVRHDLAGHPRIVVARR